MSIDPTRPFSTSPVTSVGSASSASMVVKVQFATGIENITILASDNCDQILEKIANTSSGQAMGGIKSISIDIGNFGGITTLNAEEAIKKITAPASKYETHCPNVLTYLNSFPWPIIVHPRFSAELPESPTVAKATTVGSAAIAASIRPAAVSAPVSAPLFIPNFKRTVRDSSGEQITITVTNDDTFTTILDKITKESVNPHPTTGITDNLNLSIGMVSVRMSNADEETKKISDKYGSVAAYLNRPPVANLMVSHFKE